MINPREKNVNKQTLQTLPIFGFGENSYQPFRAAPSPGVVQKALMLLLLAVTSITGHLLERFSSPVSLSSGAINAMRLC